MNEIKIINEIKQNLYDAFNKGYFNTVNNKDNRKSFENTINNYLRELEAEQKISPYKLEDVEVTDGGDNTINVDLMRAFKNFPKEEQEKIYCEMTGLNKNDVSEFIYNKEGYIKAFKPQKAMEYISINITVGE